MMTDHLVLLLAFHALDLNLERDHLTYKSLSMLLINQSIPSHRQDRKDHCATQYEQVPHSQ